MLLLALVLCLASGQLYSVEYIYGTPDCSGELFSISSVFVSPPTSVCQVRGCQANSQFQTSSYVQCQSLPPSPPSNMPCGVDLFSNQDCSGNVETRVRVALGVCVRQGVASIRYTDCSLDGKPSTFVQYSDAACQFPSTLPSISQVPNRVCVGGTCQAGQKIRCNEVLPPTPPPSSCVVSPDVNGDGRVDLVDMLFMLNVWGECGTNIACNKADLNCDGRVNLFEMSILISAWTG